MFAGLPSIESLLIVGPQGRTVASDPEGLPAGASPLPDPQHDCWPEAHPSGRSWIRTLGSRVLVPELPRRVRFHVLLRVVGEPRAYDVDVVIVGPAPDASVVFESGRWSMGIGSLGTLRFDIEPATRVGVGGSLVKVDLPVRAEGLFAIVAVVDGAELARVPLLVSRVLRFGDRQVP